MGVGNVRKACLAAVAVVSVSACGSPNASAGPSTSSLPATEHPPTGVPKYDPTYLGPWRITSLSSVGDLTIPALRFLRQVTINFATNGGVSGFDGLNHWTGHFTRADSVVAQIKISDVVSNAMGLGPNASTLQVEVGKAFNLIQSGRPMTMQVNGAQLTIHVGQISMTADRPSAN